MTAGRRTQFLRCTEISADLYIQCTRIPGDGCIQMSADRYTQRSTQQTDEPKSLWTIVHSNIHGGIQKFAFKSLQTDKPECLQTDKPECLQTDKLECL